MISHWSGFLVLSGVILRFFESGMKRFRYEVGRNLLFSISIFKWQLFSANRYRDLVSIFNEMFFEEEYVHIRETSPIKKRLESAENINTELYRAEIKAMTPVNIIAGVEVNMLELCAACLLLSIYLFLGAYRGFDSV